MEDLDNYYTETGVWSNRRGGNVNWEKQFKL